MMRVLVAEDHVKMAEAVASGLRREGMAVDVALDGRQALDRARLTGYDVIVLDRDLPEVHGDEVCRRLAEGASLALGGTQPGAFPVGYYVAPTVFTDVLPGMRVF
jgi:DNA-binding response OmpR family regulator